MAVSATVLCFFPTIRVHSNQYLTVYSHVDHWLQASSKEVLQRELGARAGATLWDFAHGVDDRRVEPTLDRKSVGAEVNWGVRFGTKEDATAFLKTLAGEVAARAVAAGVTARTITLKVKRAKKVQYPIAHCR
jgi:nucleotidyltransferase/DNA polymerase involved in DNA repair